MTELVASYATGRYVLRLIRPDEDSAFMALVADSPSGSSFTGGASLRTFEQMRTAAQRAEENYWRAAMSMATGGDKAIILSGWEHFRLYAGLLPLDITEEQHGEGNESDRGGSDRSPDE